MWCTRTRTHKTLYIRDNAFNNLLNGKKKYELRICRGIIEKLRPGETIYILNGCKKMCIIRKIKSIHMYEDFSKLLSELGCGNCLPGHTLATGITHMNNIYNISLQTKYRVVAVEFY